MVVHIESSLYIRVMVICLLGIGGLLSCSDKSQVTIEAVSPKTVESRILAATKQNKAVLVNLWATWCSPCIEEMPYLAELQEKYKDRLDIIFISADMEEDVTVPLEILEQRGIMGETYIMLDYQMDYFNWLENQWNGALPFTKIYDTQGKEVVFWDGGVSIDVFEKYLQKILL